MFMNWRQSWLLNFGIRIHHGGQLSLFQCFFTFNLCDNYVIVVSLRWNYFHELAYLYMIQTLVSTSNPIKLCVLISFLIPTIGVSQSISFKWWPLSSVNDCVEQNPFSGFCIELNLDGFQYIIAHILMFLLALRSRKTTF